MFCVRIIRQAKGGTDRPVRRVAIKDVMIGRLVKNDQITRLLYTAQLFDSFSVTRRSIYESTCIRFHATVNEVFRGIFDTLSFSPSPRFLLNLNHYSYIIARDPKNRARPEIQDAR